MSDDEYEKLQQELMENPQLGAVMPGCGGLRKIRRVDSKRGKGKRGGVRVIYLYIANTKWFYMIDIFDKDEKDDLTSAEKKMLSKLAAQLKQQGKSM